MINNRTHVESETERTANVHSLLSKKDLQRTCNKPKRIARYWKTSKQVISDTLTVQNYKNHMGKTNIRDFVTGGVPKLMADSIQSFLYFINLFKSLL